MNKLVNAWETVTGRNTISYCDLEANEGDFSYTDDRGGFVSVIAINGMARLFAPADLEGLATRLAKGLSQMMRTSSHQIEFHREYEPFEADQVGGDIQRYLDGMRQTARTLNYEADWLIEDYSNHFGRTAQNQNTYMVFRTDPKKLDKHQVAEILEQAARERETREFKAGDTMIPIAGNHEAMSPVNRYRSAVLIHEGTVRSVADLFAREGMDLTILGHHALGAVIRGMMSRDATPENYRPVLLGDKMHLRVPRYGGKITPSDILPIPLRDQFFAEDIDLNDEVLTVGTRIYRAAMMDLPGDWEAFGALQRALQQADRKMPWRITMRAKGNGLSGDGIRKWLAGLFRFVPGPNAEIKEALMGLEQRFKDGEAIVGWTLDAVTWAPKDDPTLLSKRHTALVRSLETWGGTKVKNRAGNTLDSMTATVPALRRAGPSPVTLQPLSDVLIAAPLTDSASPWRGEIANIAYQTMSGNFWPACFPSAQQKAFVKFIYAGMGGGKSVTMGAEAIGLMFDQRLASLPIIGCVDFGPSSLGAIRTAQSFLGHDRQHLARYHRLKNDPTDGLNPLDLPLGFSQPLASHRDFLVGLLAMMVQSPGHALPQGIEGLLSRILDLAYGDASDNVTAKRYSPGVIKEVDRAIEVMQFTVDAHTTWREIRDFMAEHRKYNLARLAQSCAVPDINDVARCCRKESIMAGIGKQVVEGVPMFEYVYNALTTAAGLYPVLAGRSRLDFSGVRFLSLDLDEVCPRGDVLADKQTAIMQLVAVRTVSALMSYSTDDVKFAEPAYRDWFESWVQELNRVPRRIQIDEYHRTAIGKTAEERSASPSRKAVMVLIRQGRKNLIEQVLASQLLDDADPELLQLCTAIICMGAPEDADIATNVAHRFGLGAAGEELLLTALNRPGRFIAIYSQMKNRPTSTALLEIPVPGRLLWALSSSKEEDNVRSAIVKAFGDSRGLKILATVYPNPAMIEREVKARIEARRQRGASGAYDAIAEIIKDIIKRAESIQ